MTGHVAQLNIGRFRYAMDDARMAAFTNLNRIDAFAERREGFLWRRRDSDNATSVRYLALIILSILVEVKTGCMSALRWAIST